MSEKEIIEVEIDHNLAHTTSYRVEKVAALIQLLDDVSHENGRDPYEYRDRKWCLADAVHLRRLIQKLRYRNQLSARATSQLREERDLLKAEVDKQREKDAKEKADRERQAIECERRVRWYLKDKFQHDLHGNEIIENLLGAYLKDSEEFEFCRSQFVSNVLCENFIYGDQEKAEALADIVSKKINLR
jgi:hypothetical protein